MVWKDIAQSAAIKMQSFVRVVNSENYDSFINDDPQKNKIILFTDKKRTSPLFKSLSKAFKDRLSFGEVRKVEESGSKGLFEKFGVNQTPTLMALSNPESFKGEIYDTNEMKID